MLQDLAGQQECEELVIDSYSVLLKSLSESKPEQGYIQNGKDV